MASADPAFLPLGTEVSAKYRGAFCEAKVKKIVKSLKIKVQYQGGGTGVVTHEDVVGTLKAGCVVEVKSVSEEPTSATILKITDSSMYTVVFDDGDENTLRRTQLCLKSEKHFMKYETLDDLPLTHPEHFGTPVLKKKSKKRRAASSPHSSDSETEDESDEPAPRQYPGRLVDMVGKVLLMTQEDRKKTMIIPVLVVQPNADTTELKTRDHLLVKSFKDSKFYAVSKKEAKEFTRDAAKKNEDKTLKAVYEKALLYFDAKELPTNWEKEDLFGSDSEEEDEDDVSSDDEQSEEKDMFVAQLYKFMEERGTPLNKAPLIGSRDLNLYRLYRTVGKLGGYNRVTNQMKWRLVYSKMGLPNSVNAATLIKTAYKKFLHGFDDFYRKLGSTMGTNISRPSRSRHSSGRNIPGFRDRERPDSMSPKSPRSGMGPFKKENKKEIKEETSDTSVEEKKESSKTAIASPEVRPGRKSNPPELLDMENVSPSKRKTRGGVEDRAGKATPTPTKETKRFTPKATESDSVPEKDDKKKKVLKKKVGKQAEEEEADDDTETESHKSETDSLTGSKASSVSSAVTGKSKSEYPPGTRLRVRYGKGKTQQVFQAKVLDNKVDSGIALWLVHYAGWNTRYDEWVKKDRIVEVLQLPDGKTGEPTPAKDIPKKTTPTAASKQGPIASKIAQVKTVAQLKQGPGQAKQTPIAPKLTPAAQTRQAPSQTKQSATPKITNAVSKQGTGQKIAGRLTGATQGKPLGFQAKATNPAAKQTALATKGPSKGTPLVRKKSQTKVITKAAKDEKEKPTGKGSNKSKAPRPTRSTSLESSLSSGLSPRKRLRRNSGANDASDQEGSSESEESEEEMEKSDSEGRLTPLYGSPKSTTKGEIEDKSSEKEIDIIQRLSSSLEMDFDKASQESLERELSLEGENMQAMGKGVSDSEMDIESALSCLGKDDYKIQSSENESVNSDSDRRMVRSRSKARSDTSVKQQTKPETVKTKTDTTKEISDEIKAEVITGAKGKPAVARTKVDQGKAKEPPKTKAELKTKPDAVKTKAELATSSEDTQTAAPHRGKIASPKPKTETDIKVESEASAMVAPPKSHLDSPDTEKKAPVVDEKVPANEGREKFEAISLSTDSDEPVVIDSEDIKLTRGIELESFDLPSNEDTQEKFDLPDENSSQPSSIKDEKSKSSKKETVVKDKSESSDKSFSESSNEEHSLKGVKPEVKKTLKGRGRGKRRIEKDEVDSEEEPPKKQTRRKSKKDNEPVQKPSAYSNEDSSSAEKSDNRAAKHKLGLVSAKATNEKVTDNESIDPGSKPALSPPTIDEEFDDEQSENSQDNLNTFDLRGAIVSPAKCTPQNSAQDMNKVDDDTSPNSPPDFTDDTTLSLSKPSEQVSENASTKSELEANMEVESYLQGALPPGRESPVPCEQSNMSTGSEESDSPPKSRKSQERSPLTDKSTVQQDHGASNLSPPPAPSSGTKRKAEDQTASSSRKRKRKVGAKTKNDSKPAVLSDDDETGTGSRAALSEPSKQRHGPSKYNFVQQIEEGKNLQGEDRVNFLLSKIADLRSIYLQLKQEVASIDRRRKRHRKKQRLAAQGLIGLESALS